MERATFTIDPENYAFLTTVAAKNRSAFINTLLKKERHAHLEEAIQKANQEEAEDATYHEELSDWEITSNDGLSS